MHIYELTNKILAGLGVGTMLLGTVMAVVGVYLGIFLVSIVGALLILFGMLIMITFYRRLNI
jgi:hypothetical protein